jgi:anti-sigma factor RsiW
MVTCRDVTELVTDYLEGRLGLVARLRFWWHLRGCVHCHEYLRQMQLTRDALGRLPEVAMPDDVREEMLRRFRDWKRK